MGLPVERYLPDVPGLEVRFMEPCGWRDVDAWHGEY